MLRKFLRHRKYKKMIKASSVVILEEFAEIVSDTINHLEKEGQIKSPLHKEVLKVESTALLFWLFQRTDIFPELLHKLILDEIHNLYFLQLKKHGYMSKMAQAIADDFNLRYRTYNESLVGDYDYDLARIGVKFISFVDERAKVDSGTNDLLIPAYLSNKVVPKFKKFREVVKD